MKDFTLYTKKIKNSKDGTFFDKPFIVYNDKHFEAIISKECNKKLNKSGLEFPLVVHVDETKNHFFMKKVKYTRNDNTTGYKWRIVLLDFDTVEETEFNKVSIDDVVAELEKNDLEKDAK